MADTSAYLEAERWIRERGLPRKYPGHSFSEQRLRIGKLNDGGPEFFRFDAVSADKSIIASVKASSGLTSGGKLPTAKTKDAYTDILFLSMAKGGRRLLVLTDPDFFRIFQRVSEGRIPRGVELLHIPLPRPIQRHVDAARRVASRETSPRHAG